MRGNSVARARARGRRAGLDRRAVRQVRRGRGARRDRRAARPTSTPPASRPSSAASSRSHGPRAERAGRGADDRDGLRLRAGRARRRRWRCARAAPRRGARRRRLLLARGRRRRGERGHARARSSARRSATPTPSATARCERVRVGRARALVHGRRREPRRAISVGGAEHFGLPAAFPRLREVNVYLGWFGAARAPAAGGDAGRLGRDAACPACAGCCEFAGGRLADARRRRAASRARRRAAMSWIAAVAFDAAGEPLAEVHLTGADGYASPPTSWPGRARAAAARRVKGTGAIGPVEAFGLDELERGCAVAGLSRTAPDQRAQPHEPGGERPGRPRGRRRAVTRSGGFAGRLKSFQRMRSSARAGANAAGSRSGQISQRGARGAGRVEDRR